MTEMGMGDRGWFINELEGMSLEQLQLYIERRLRGIDLTPPPDERTSEHAGYILEVAFEKSASLAFRERFEAAIANLLTREQLRVSDCDYLSELLFLCEKYRFSLCSIPVAGMIVGGDLRGLISRNGDLHFRALMSFARLPQGLRMRDIWTESINDPRYVSASFAALLAQGFEMILPRLGDYVTLYGEKPECFDVVAAIAILYAKTEDIVDRRRISYAVLGCFTRLPPEARGEISEIVRKYDPGIEASEFEEYSSHQPAYELLATAFRYLNGNLPQAFLDQITLPERQLSFALGVLHLELNSNSSESLKFFTKAYQLGLSSFEAKMIQSRLPDGPSLDRLKDLLFPVLLGVGDDKLTEAIGAAKLRAWLAREKQNAERERKWTRIQRKIQGE